MEGAAQHVLNVGLSNFDKDYRLRRCVVEQLAASRVNWMEQHQLIHVKVDRQLLRTAILDYLRGIAEMHRST